MISRSPNRRKNAARLSIRHRSLVFILIVFTAIAGPLAVLVTQAQIVTNAESATTNNKRNEEVFVIYRNELLTQTERDQLVAQLTANNNDAGRASVLRTIAEKQSLRDAEFRKAFVLMQYFGYLRRNPNDAPDFNYNGYNFWLDKLNQHNGNFITAEMVKAFILSIEYRQRFGP